MISVWAYNNKGYWFLVDGICQRQLMDKNIDDLFRLAQIYDPQKVGIEVSGQQGGFIQWIQKEMLVRNQWFSLASDNNSNKPGIRPVTKKLRRFNTVVPWFKSGIVYLPEDLRRTDPLTIEMEEELCSATVDGFKSKHDDVIDTISMLSCFSPWKPSGKGSAVTKDASGIWQDTLLLEQDDCDLENYIV